MQIGKLPERIKAWVLSGSGALRSEPGLPPANRLEGDCGPLAFSSYRLARDNHELRPRKGPGDGPMSFASPTAGFSSVTAGLLRRAPSGRDFGENRPRFQTGYGGKANRPTATSSGKWYPSFWWTRPRVAFPLGLPVEVLPLFGGKNGPGSDRHHLAKE